MARLPLDHERPPDLTPINNAFELHLCSIDGLPAAPSTNTTTLLAAARLLFDIRDIASDSEALPASPRAIRHYGTQQDRQVDDRSRKDCRRYGRWQMGEYRASSDLACAHLLNVALPVQFHRRVSITSHSALLQRRQYLRLLGRSRWDQARQDSGR